MIVYVLVTLSLPRQIGACQYRRMSKSLIVLDAADTVACCSPLTAQPLSQAQADRIAPLLKALADPVRLRLISLVASHSAPDPSSCHPNNPSHLPPPPILPPPTP